MKYDQLKSMTLLIKQRMLKFTVKTKKKGEQTYLCEENGKYIQHRGNNRTKSTKQR